MSSLGALNALSAQSTDPFARNPAANSSTSSGSGTSKADSNSQLTGDSFIKLLTAQLQVQDPLNPIDPTSFVTQLVQFNQLAQLIDINSTLSAAASAPGAGNPQAPNPQVVASPSEAQSGASAAATHI
jgi:hypothetical protein